MDDECAKFRTVSVFERGTTSIFFSSPPPAGRHNRAGRSLRQSGEEDGVLARSPCCPPHRFATNNVSVARLPAGNGQMSPLPRPAGKHHGRG